MISLRIGWIKLTFFFFFFSPFIIICSFSSLGQNLKTSNFIWENIFAICISVIGLILFSLLIGNMQVCASFLIQIFYSHFSFLLSLVIYLCLLQKYLQSITVRVEEMRMKRRDAEQWMSHRMLPEDLRDRIRRYEQYRWQETRGVKEQNLIQNLPKDLRRDIKRHLCWALLTRVRRTPFLFSPLLLNFSDFRGFLFSFSTFSM